MKKRGYEILLPVTYAAMAALCVYLAAFAEQRESTADIAVNVCMFIIVGIIWANCALRCFRPVNSMIDDLDRCTEKFRKDAAASKTFLWSRYGKDPNGIFTDERLKAEFEDYRQELDRIAHLEKAYYKCDIEDYINYDLMDATIHRNMLNQVPGAMTGLGILGTFIGLSLGLQSFSAGTTAEITNSIAPLMDGIKVAFHTSIYGMVFSLVFNYVYKRKLDDAETAVDRFLNAFRKYVLPDTTTDGINKLMELEQQQTEATKALADTVAVQLSKGLQQLLEPQFDRFDHTIENFASYATRDQKEALTDVTRHFLTEMNHQMGDSFAKLEETVEAAYETGKDNSELLQRLQSYSHELRSIQYTVERELKDLPTSVNETFHIIDQNLVDVETSFARTIEDIRKVTTQTPDQLSQAVSEFMDAAGRTAEAMDDLTASLDDLLAKLDSQDREEDEEDGRRSGPGGGSGLFGRGRR